MPIFAPKKPVVEAPKVETPPAPAVLTRDDAKAIISEALGGVATQLGAALGELRQGVEQLASQRPTVVVQGQTPVVQPTGHLSDEEIDRALLGGTGGAAVIRNLIDREVSRRADSLLKEHIEPLRAFGAESLANISQELAAGKMPYYGRFKKEIDSRLAMLTPEVRANPASIKMIHDAVVGENAQVLLREAGEEAVRKTQETKPAVTAGTGAGGTVREAPELPSAVEVGGQDAIEALRHKGRGGMNQDELARSMGYESWAAYQKQYDDLLKAETQGNA